MFCVFQFFQKEIRMKLKILVSAFLVLLAVGCQQNSPVATDDNKQAEEGGQSLAKTKGGDVIHLGVVQENSPYYFTIYPGNTYAVTFQPWKTGNWKCYSWHMNASEYSSSVGVSYYWRNAYNPNDPYHWWTNDAAGYGFALRAEEDFHSGSAGITYEIRFRQWTDVMLPMVIWIATD